MSTSILPESERPTTLRDLLPVTPPCILVFAPSRRAPDYELQIESLKTAGDDTPARLPVLLEVFSEGTCNVDGRGVDEKVGRTLRTHMNVSSDGFLVVVISEKGEIVRTFESPVKPAVLLEAMQHVS